MAVGALRRLIRGGASSTMVNCHWETVDPPMRKSAVAGFMSPALNSINPAAALALGSTVRVSPPSSASVRVTGSPSGAWARTIN
ncbi:MAG: hypothetical protein A49_21690 [Methyloceanibacter sp.]|nr:MAG: hypothetical protein A49_21690 [Methyloceanibacter sp.]